MYILGKWLQFFSSKNGKGWSPDFYDAATEATGISFVVGASQSPSNLTTSFADPADQGTLPKSITNYGILSQENFLKTLAHSRMLIGVGDPVTSPTPYDALCLGVPFLNPIVMWDRSNPQDRSKWVTQHGPLQLLDPPYVYNVYDGDRDGFLRAIRGAIADPLPDRYILERMRMSAVEARVQTLIETDWKAKAGELLEKRRLAGEHDFFQIR